VQKVREAAARTQCRNSLHQIGLALHNFHDTNNRFPSACQIGQTWYGGVPREAPPNGLNPSTGYPTEGPFFAWCLRIAPYLEMGNVYQQVQWQVWPWWQYQQGKPAIGDNTLNGVVAKILQCPADTRSNLTNYDGGQKFALTGYMGVNGLCEGQYPNASLAGQEGVIYVNSSVRMAQIRDGTSQTLLVGERPPSTSLYYGWWFAGSGDYPYFGTTDVNLGVREWSPVLGKRDAFRYGTINDPAEEHRWHYWSLHPGGGQFLLCDGSVQFFPYSADAILPAMATRNGGEVVSQN